MGPGPAQVCARRGRGWVQLPPAGSGRSWAEWESALLQRGRCRERAFSARPAASRSCPQSTGARAGRPAAASPGGSEPACGPADSRAALSCACPGSAVCWKAAPRPGAGVVRSALFSGPGLLAEQFRFVPCSGGVVGAGALEQSDGASLGGFRRLGLRSAPGNQPARSRRCRPAGPCRAALNPFLYHSSPNGGRGARERRGRRVEHRRAVPASNCSYSPVGQSGPGRPDHGPVPARHATVPRPPCPWKQPSRVLAHCPPAQPGRSRTSSLTRAAGGRVHGRAQRRAAGPAAAGPAALTAPGPGPAGGVPRCR